MRCIPFLRIGGRILSESLYAEYLSISDIKNVTAFYPSRASRKVSVRNSRRMTKTAVGSLFLREIMKWMSYWMRLLRYFTVDVDELYLSLMPYPTSPGDGGIGAFLLCRVE